MRIVRLFRKVFEGNKKRPSVNGLFYRINGMILFLNYRVRRTNGSARSAVYAGSGVDYIDVAFADAVNGAFRFAGSAGNAFVSDLMRHFSSFFNNFYCFLPQF